LPRGCREWRVVAENHAAPLVVVDSPAPGRMGNTHAPCRRCHRCDDGHVAAMPASLPVEVIDARWSVPLAPIDLGGASWRCILTKSSMPGGAGPAGRLRGGCLLEAKAVDGGLQVFILLTHAAQVDVVLHKPPRPFCCFGRALGRRNHGVGQRRMRRTPELSRDRDSCAPHRCGGPA